MTESCGLASLAVKRSRSLPQVGSGHVVRRDGWVAAIAAEPAGGTEGAFDGLRPVSYVFSRSAVLWLR
jgi:hypothetical protein